MLFRCAATQFAGFQIAEDVVSRLREATNRILSDSSDETEQRCLQQSVDWNLFAGYFLPGSDSGRNTVLLPVAGTTPCLLTINQYTIVFDYKIPQVSAIGEELGIDLGIRHIGVTTRIFSAEERETLLKVYHTINADRFLHFLAKDFINAYLQHHHRQPSAEQVYRFIDDVTTGKSLPTTRYEIQRIAQLRQKHIRNEEHLS